MENIALWGVIIVFALFSLQYLAGPILVYKSSVFPKEYKFNILDTESFLSERSETFLELHNQLRSLGFEHSGSSEFFLSHVSMYFSIYSNQKLKIACILSSAKSELINSTQIEFTQLYPDGSVLNVNNNNIHETYPANNLKMSFRFPEINDIEQLLKISQKLGPKFKDYEQRIPLTKNREFDDVESFLNKELKLLIDNGWVSSRTTNDYRKLTIKGALLLTWKNCWPVNKILNNREINFSQHANENT